MSLSDGCRVLQVTKAVLCTIRENTVARALGISDSVYLFH